MKRRALIIVFSFALAISELSRAQGGGVPVRVTDDPTLSETCINATTDRVWLTLRRLITNRAQGWFTKDNDVEVLINAQVRTDPQPPKPLSFPLETTAKFGDAPAGEVSVPIEYPIVSGLSLTQEDVTYSGLGVEITLLNLRGRTKLGDAIQALDTITGSSKLPIPSSPYTQGLTYLLDFANSAITNDINQQNSNDKFKSGSLDFNFDPDGTCKGDFETTGTKAILFATGTQNPGPGAVYIDIGKVNDYCWAADLTPAFVLKAVKKENLPCNDPSYQSKYQSVSNNYVGFYLNKRKVVSHLGYSAAAKKDRQESLRRCEANGITEPSRCPGGQP